MIIKRDLPNTYLRIYIYLLFTFIMSILSNFI